MPDTSEHYITKEQLDLSLARLENKLDARFNSIDARFNGIDDKFNGQRNLLFGILLGVLAQILNAWIMHGAGR
jgi:hypothetical protein